MNQLDASVTGNAKTSGIKSTLTLLRTVLVIKLETSLSLPGCSIFQYRYTVNVPKHDRHLIPASMRAFRVGLLRLNLSIR